MFSLRNFLFLFLFSYAYGQSAPIWVSSTNMCYRSALFLKHNEQYTTDTWSNFEAVQLNLIKYKRLIGLDLYELNISSPWTQKDLTSLAEKFGKTLEYLLAPNQPLPLEFFKQFPKLKGLGLNTSLQSHATLAGLAEALPQLKSLHCMGIYSSIDQEKPWDAAFLATVISEFKELKALMIDFSPGGYLERNRFELHALLSKLYPEPPCLMIRGSYLSSEDPYTHGDASVINIEDFKLLWKQAPKMMLCLNADANIDFANDYIILEHQPEGICLDPKYMKGFLPIDRYVFLDFKDWLLNGSPIVTEEEPCEKWDIFGSFESSLPALLEDRLSLAKEWVEYAFQFESTSSAR